MWRPEGWKCPFTFTVTVNGMSFQDAFETGADVMERGMINWIRSHEEHTLVPDEGDEFDYFPVPSKELAEMEKI